MSNKDLGKVIGIQIAPWKSVHDGSPEGSIEIQMDGADADTEGYALYLRHENGMAIHNRDYVTEAGAVMHARATAKELGVKVEPYGWQVGLVHMGPAVVIDDTKAFESFALKQDFIKDVQRYDRFHPYFANQYGHYDTKNARVMWDGAVAWTAALFELQGKPLDYLNGNEIRVTVEGRTGVGKSAVCGLIEQFLSTIDVPVQWKNGDHAKGTATKPWQQELKEFGSTVKIVERNLVPRIIYEEAQQEHVNAAGVLTETQVKRIDGWAAQADVPAAGLTFGNLDEDSEVVRTYIQAAVDHYVNPNMLGLEKDDPDRDTKLSAFKASLVDHLLEHRASVERFEVRVKHFIADHNAT